MNRHRLVFSSFLELYSHLHPNQTLRNPYLLYRFCIQLSFHFIPEVYSLHGSASIPECLGQADAHYSIQFITLSSFLHKRPTIAQIRLQIYYDLLRLKDHANFWSLYEEVVPHLLQGSVAWPHPLKRAFLFASLMTANSKIAADAFSYFCIITHGASLKLNECYAAFAYLQRTMLGDPVFNRIFPRFIPEMAKLIPITRYFEYSGYVACQDAAYGIREPIDAQVVIKELAEHGNIHHLCFKVIDNSTLSIKSPIEQFFQFDVLRRLDSRPAVRSLIESLADLGYDFNRRGSDGHLPLTALLRAALHPSHERKDKSWIEFHDPFFHRINDQFWCGSYADRSFGGDAP